MITWSFILNGRSHIIELYNSKLSGKKKLLVDRKEFVKSKSSSLFQYGFRLSQHYFKIIQHSGEIFDLLIDNVSFDNMMSDERAGRLQKPPKKKEYSSSSYKHEDLDKEYARYHLQQVKNNSTNKHVNDFYQNGNYKKEQKYYDYNIGNEFDFSGGKSNKYPTNYQSGNSSSNKMNDFNNVQRSNKQSEQTFQHNKSILNNIGDVFGDNKGNEINLERNMNILENIDMEQILGGNTNNKGNDMFAFEMNNQGQQQSFQNNSNNNQNNFYQQPRQGNVDGFMGFNNITGNNNNNIGNNGFMQEQQHQQQQMQFNNNNNNYNQFTFDNQQNQMQFNNNNNNNTNYPQLDNQQPSNYTLNTNNQNYIQQNQTQPQPQTMLNTNQFISQPLPERNQTNTNNNNNIQAFDPSPSYFQTINQPQLSTPSLMNDPTMMDPSSFNNPSQFTNNNQQQQQIPNNNIFTVNIESQSKTPIIPQHQQEPSQNELKTKLMSTGLVNIDNLFGDSSQPNTNLNYNFNNFDK